MSIIPCVEPGSPRYIYINRHTNMVHLMVPVVGGQEISTDNTCKATLALKNFFDGDAIRELKNYQEKLIFDILIANDEEALKEQKQTRLTQINIYLAAVNAMRFSYGGEILKLLQKPTNLYQIQLRPREQDPASGVLNPIFSLIRKNDGSGTPLSALYNAMHRIFPALTIKTHDPQSILISAVLPTLSPSASFAEIQQALSKQCQNIFSLSVDFTIDTGGNPLKKEELDNLMGFGETASSEDYVEALLGSCALDIGHSVVLPPFYNISSLISSSERTEKLSILTQFFLAQVNVYCKARSISNKNFGGIFDLSPALSEQICILMSDTLKRGDNVEAALCDFLNQHATDFELSRTLNTEDIENIKQKFIRNYQIVTATQENPHMDDFMLLETEAPGDVAKLFTHQGAICIDFSEIASSVLPHQDYYAKIRQDFLSKSLEIPHQNNWIATQVDVAPECLVSRISEKYLHLLPPEILKMSLFQSFQFLYQVAQGKREQVASLLFSLPKQVQDLLTTPGVFTDYSGRTFHCTAYEYAYWAKDTQMCRVLARYMNEETKEVVQIAIDNMKRINPETGQPRGLAYQQNGQTYYSAHYDFTPLTNAYKTYIDNYDKWVASRNWTEMSQAWLCLGKAQSNVPVHVAYEYCRKDRGFIPIPSFTENEFPQELTFFNINTEEYNLWYPLAEDNTGLGFDLAIIRGEPGAGGYRIGARKESMQNDLAAITRLDAVRTMEIALLEEQFSQEKQEQVSRRQP